MSNIREQLTCPICMGVCVEPVQCPKGHIFCDNCIRTHLSVNIFCPLDRTHLTVDKLSKSLLAANILAGVVVDCIYKECSVKYQLANEQKHLLNECQYHTYVCPDCKEKAFFGHSQQCPEKVIECDQKCGASFVRRKASEHQAECPFVLISCPNACDQLLLFNRSDLNYHLSRCRLTEVECPYRPYGCYETMTRENIWHHCRQRNDYHNEIIITKRGDSRIYTGQLRQTVDLFFEPTDGERKSNRIIDIHGNEYVIYFRKSDDLPFFKITKKVRIDPITISVDIRMYKYCFIFDDKNVEYNVSNSCINKSDIRIDLEY